MNPSGPHTLTESPCRRPATRRPCNLVCIVALAVGSIGGNSGCGRIIVSADDAIVRDDGHTTLIANVERERVRDVRRNVAGVEVGFSVDGAEVGRAVTDGDGRATLDASVAPGVQSFKVAIKYEGHHHDHNGRVFHWHPDRTIVAVDIDDTVSSTSYRVLLFHDEDNKSNPLQDSSDTLKQLSNDFQVVYLTGRPRFLWDKTQHWLERHDFPAGPIVTAPNLRQCILQGIFKRVELAQLRKSWPGALIGIGDRGVDINAYHRNGMLTLLVGGTDSMDPQRNIYRFGKWLAIRDFYRANQAVLANPERLEAALKSGTGFQLPGVAAQTHQPSDAEPPVSNAMVVK